MIRHCLFIRILWKSFRFPVRFSSRFEGGILRSIISCELFNILNFRRPRCWISSAIFLTRTPFQIISVSLEPNEIIMLLFCVTNVKGMKIIFNFSNLWSQKQKHTFREAKNKSAPWAEPKLTTERSRKQKRTLSGAEVDHWAENKSAPWAEPKGGFDE